MLLPGTTLPPLCSSSLGVEQTMKTSNLATGGGRLDLEQKVKSPCPLVLSVKVMISVASDTQGSSGSIKTVPIGSSNRLVD